MSSSDDTPIIPPTRAAQSQSAIPATAAMRGPVSGDLPRTSSNYSPKARATSGRPPWLPANLSAQFTIVDVFPGGAQAEIYLVADATEEQRVAKVYHSSTQMKEAVLGKVRGVQLPHVVRMYDFGHDDGHWWETQEYARHGTLLDLIGSDGPKLSPSLLREIVTQIHEALTSLHGLKIEHRDLKPANVLVRSLEPLDLALTDFGVSSDMEGSVRNSGLGGTSLYAPPEGQGTFAGGLGSDSGEDAKTIVFKERWDNWSLGMMIVEMLTGKHPFAGQDPNTVVMRLIIKNVDELVAGVTDANWRKLCRGLLRRDSTLRWGNEEVGLWLKNPNDVSLKVAEEGASATAGYSFSGRLYYSLQELGEAFYGNWAAARRTWEIDRNGLLRWIQNDLGQSAIVDAIEKAIASVRKLNVPNGLRADTETLTIATLLAPAALPIVNGIELSLKNISACAELAKTDSTAKKKLLELLQSQVLKIAKGSPDGVRLASIADAWESACRSYERLHSELSSNGVSSPELSDDDRISILMVNLEIGSTLKYLRQSAREATSADAMACPWYASLGNPDQSDPTKLILMARTGQAADQAAKKAREATNRQKDEQNHQSAIKLYGGALKLLIGFCVGITFGAITAYVPGFLVYTVVTWIFGEAKALTIAITYVLLCGALGVFADPFDIKGRLERTTQTGTAVMSSAGVISLVIALGLFVVGANTYSWAQGQFDIFRRSWTEVDTYYGNFYQVTLRAGESSEPLGLTQGANMDGQCFFWSSSAPRSTVNLAFRGGIDSPTNPRQVSTDSVGSCVSYGEWARISMVASAKQPQTIVAGFSSQWGRVVQNGGVSEYLTDICPVTRRNC